MGLDVSFPALTPLVFPSSLSFCSLCAFGYNAGFFCPPSRAFPLLDWFFFPYFLSHSPVPILQLGLYLFTWNMYVPFFSFLFTHPLSAYFCFISLLCTVFKFFVTASYYKFTDPLFFLTIVTAILFRKFLFLLYFFVSCVGASDFLLLL